MSDEAKTLSGERTEEQQRMSILGTRGRSGEPKRYYPHRRARPHFDRTDKASETAARHDGMRACAEGLDEVEQEREDHDPEDDECAIWDAFGSAA